MHLGRFYREGIIAHNNYCVLLPSPNNSHYKHHEYTHLYYCVNEVRKTQYFKIIEVPGILHHVI